MKENIKNVIREIMIKQGLPVSENSKDDSLYAVSDDEFIKKLKVEFFEDKDLVLFTAETDFKISQKKKNDFAVLTSFVNNFLIEGSYDFDYSSGEVSYRFCCSEKIDKAIIDEKLKTIEKLCDKGFKVFDNFLSTGDFYAAVSDVETIKSSIGSYSLRESDKAAYNKLKRIVGEAGFRNKADDDKMTVSFDLLGKDLPMSYDISVIPERSVFVLRSVQPFIVRRDKKNDLAVASCIASNLLVDGSFGYNCDNDTIAYKMSTPFLSDIINERTLDYLISCSLSTVEKFNDKFLELNKGRININKFIDFAYGE